MSSLRHDSACADLPVIILSGRALPADVEAGRALGATHLTKPFSPEALVEVGVRPTVIDEGSLAGGQIYRRQPANFGRPHETLYGYDAEKARALHDAFEVGSTKS